MLLGYFKVLLHVVVGRFLLKKSGNPIELGQSHLFHCWSATGHVQCHVTHLSPPPRRGCRCWIWFL